MLAEYGDTITGVSMYVYKWLAILMVMLATTLYPNCINKGGFMPKQKKTNPVVEQLKITAKSLREVAKHLTATANQLKKI